MLKIKQWFLAAVMAVVMCSSAMAYVQEGFIYDDGQFQSILFPGSYATHVYGINNNGYVVGSYQSNATIFYQVFVYHNGIYESIPAPNPGQFFSGINDLGQLVGGAGVYTDGVVTRPGGSGINNSGDTVGDDGDSAFLYSNDDYAILNAPGATYFTQGVAINNNGQALLVADGIHAFLYDQGSYTALNVTIDNCFCQDVVGGMNNLDQVVVGDCFYSDGECTTIAAPPRTSVLALTGINDSGVIVGNYAVAPEPSTWALLLLGFVGLGLAGRPLRHANGRHISA